MAKMKMGSPFLYDDNDEVVGVKNKDNTETLLANTISGLAGVSSAYVPLGTQTDSGGTPTGVLVDQLGTPLPALRATIVPRTGTLASLLTLAGNNGEIGVATDVDAFVKFNGTAGQAKAYYRSRLAGKTTITAGAANPAGAASTWTTVDFTAGVVIEDDLGAANLAGSSIVVPASVTYYEVIFYLPFSGVSGASGSARRARVLGGSAGLNLVSQTPNLAATGGPAQTLQGFIPKENTNGVPQTLQLQSYHDSTAVPNLGVAGASTPWMTVLMYV